MKLENVSAAYNNLEHFITDPTISNWYLTQLVSNIPHEHDKSQNYIRFGQYMPSSCSFSSLTDFANLSKRSFIDINGNKRSFISIENNKI